MNGPFLLPAVYLADKVAGDPEWLPHPVRLMGWAIAKGETLLRQSDESDKSALLAGALLTTTVVVTSYFVTRLTIARAYRCSMVWGWLTEVVLGWTCLASRNLEEEACSVLAALESGDVAMARHRLARIVGRETRCLDVAEICRALIETLAESASDGVMAPLFYMALGGVPLAMAYKAVNTLDSMIGHADDRYFYFGKAAARLDDAANFAPARLTAMATVAASSWTAETHPGGAWKLWLRDGGRHKSPNAGQPESAMAGALGVRLGGGNWYGGEFVPAEPIGEELRAPQPQDARKAVRIVSVVTLLGLGAGILCGALFHSRRTS
jgi:adenosylcobinamide-phosphate synthase